MTVQRIQLIQSNIQKLLDRLGATELTRRADNVLAEAKRLAPRADGTRSFSSTISGNLANSLIKGLPQTTRDGRQIRIFSNARNSRGEPYALFVVRGTKPHIIQARNQPNLKFFWIQRGVGFVGPRVSHPGTKPNNFLREALKAFHRR